MSLSVTLDDPTEDGFISHAHPMYTRNTTGIYMSGEEGAITQSRPYMEWDIRARFPVNAKITSVALKYHGRAKIGYGKVHEMLNTKPSKKADNATGNQAIFDEAGEGTIYVDDATFPVVGADQTLDLGDDAVTDLQAQIAKGWFAIGIKCTGVSGFEIYAEDYASVDPPPTLYVEYMIARARTHSWKGEKTIRRVWHDGRQKLVYVFRRIKHMSPL